MESDMALAPYIELVEGTEHVVAYVAEEPNEQGELLIQLFKVGVDDRYIIEDAAIQAVMGVYSTAYAKVEYEDPFDMYVVVISSTPYSPTGHTHNLICIAQDIDSTLTNLLDERDSTEEVTHEN